MAHDDNTNVSGEVLPSQRIVRSRARTWGIVLVIFVSGVIVMGIITLFGNLGRSGAVSGNRTVANVSEALEDIVSKEGGAVLGDSNAPVTVVVFADYQCPFCAKFFRDVAPRIKEKYIAAGKVKMAHKDFPFLGEASVRAAEAAACANAQGKFWEYHDAVFRAHDGGRPEYSDEQLKDFAAGAGLNLEKFNDCTGTRKYQQEIWEDMADARRLGVDGTPTVFINGRKLVGALPFADFAAVIEQALLE